jgi:DNA-binding protein H-NS
MTALPNIKNLDIESLLSLRARIDSQLISMRKDLQEQIARLDRAAKPAPNGSDTLGRRGLGRRGPLKGKKLAPKYHNPADTSQTWAGRGATPVWMTALLKQGKKRDDFLINQAPAGRKPGRRQKRRARK